MYYPQTPAELWLWLAIFGAIFGLLADLLFRIGRAAYDLGKTWVIELPSIPGSLASIERVKLRRNQYTKKVGDDLETRIISATATNPTRKGPIAVIGKETGWNLRAPSKEEIQKQVTPDDFLAMTVCDPKTYYRAEKENDWEDFLSATQAKPHWLIQVAPFFAIVAVLALAMIAFMLWKILPVVTAAGA